MLCQMPDYDCINILCGDLLGSCLENHQLKIFSCSNERKKGGLRSYFAGETTLHSIKKQPCNLSQINKKLVFELTFGFLRGFFCIKLLLCTGRSHEKFKLKMLKFCFNFRFVDGWNLKSLHKLAASCCFLVKIKNSVFP